MCYESCEFYVPEEDAMREKYKIVIYEDEPGVVRTKFLLGKKVIDEGMAKCNPADEYSFPEGARIAVARCKSLPCFILSDRFIDDANTFIRSLNNFSGKLEQYFSI